MTEVLANESASPGFRSVKRTAYDLGISMNRVFYCIKKGYIKSSIVADKIVIMDDEYVKLQEMVNKSSELESSSHYIARKKMQASSFYGKVRRGKIQTCRIGKKIYIERNA